MTKRVLMLVEGPTEERFVKDVLGPYLWQRGLDCRPTVLVTRREKAGGSHKGGATTFGKFANDLSRLLPQIQSRAIVTTMLDLYALPTDFPGLSKIPTGKIDPVTKVERLERALHDHFGGSPFFVPFLTLHEFEALLFSECQALPKLMSAPGQSADMERICRQAGAPENINDGRETAPSKRLSLIFPGYRKTLHGPMAAAAIGVERMRAACPHFDRWLATLEGLAAT